MKVTTRQAADLLGVSPQAVRTMALRGKLKRYGSGRPGWYDLDEIRAVYATRVANVAPQVIGV